MNTLCTLKCVVVVISIVLSTALLLVASLSNVELAWCGDDKEADPITLQSLVDRGDASAISVCWLLYLSIAFGFARLSNYLIKCVKVETWRFLTALDIAEGIMASGMTMVAIFVTADKVFKDDMCEFRDGASPFIGLLIASCGISISVSLFDVITLVLGDAYSYSPYQQVMDTQQQQDQSISLDCVGGDENKVEVVRLEVEGSEDSGDTALGNDEESVL